MRRDLFISLLLLLGTSAGSAQQPAQPAPQPDAQGTVTFRAETNFVEVHAIVTDRTGAFVRGLTADDFEVYEGGRLQKPSVFSMVDLPIERPFTPVNAAGPIERTGELRRDAVAQVLDGAAKVTTKEEQVKSFQTAFMHARDLDQIKAAELNAPSGSRTSNRLEVNLDRDKKVLEDLFSHLTSKSQTLGAFGQALRGFGDGGASIFVAYQERDAGVKRAEGQVHEANAKKAEASYSASSEQAQTAREAFNKVLDMVAEIDRSRSETSKSIARI